MRNCETERLPDGSQLSVWGPSVEASLRLEGGSLLRLRDITGYLGTGSPGPLLKKYPITREQLRELALKPELRP
ncbi:hypothetical protein STRCI_005463 [Streptomyces cinnabarinus]|uniref:Uncharacterized protein n=1 Tax=Streptomyces cinnabarinus TaxID=67287 RepID=A0ABY7KHQ5_9ACTN|nr:hypothetical protein [Streptomyces cinnabarinus]WAZ24075.1 hypothetical protein STRCI_005463 [Streptomyces cinnabarinus]